MAETGRSARLREIARLPAVAGGVIAVCVIGALLLARVSGGLQFLDLATWDLFISLKTFHATPSHRLVVVAVTEDDIASLGTWPLTDETLNRALDVIDAEGARVIGVSRYTDPARFRTAGRDLYPERENPWREEICLAQHAWRASAPGTGGGRARRIQ